MTFVDLELISGMMLGAEIFPQEKGGWTLIFDLLIVRILIDHVTD
jgi:hypothetical protein